MATQFGIKPTLEMLQEAEKAYHNLMTGAAVQTVIDSNGERVQFFQANRQALYMYIQDLRAAVFPQDVTATNGRRPAGFLF